jgi:hypothetical protein
LDEEDTAVERKQKLHKYKVMGGLCCASLWKLMGGLAWLGLAWFAFTFTKP